MLLTYPTGIKNESYIQKQLYKLWLMHSTSEEVAVRIVQTNSDLIRSNLSLSRIEATWMTNFCKVKISFSVTSAFQLAERNRKAKIE